MSWDLREEVKKAVQDHFNTQKPFTILTITNEIRMASHAAGNGIVRHREVRPIVEDLIQGELLLSDNDFDMSRITVNVQGSPIKGVRLYHHYDDDPMDYTDTNQTMWEPVGGWDGKQVSSARPIQMQATLDDDDNGNSDPKVHSGQIAVAIQCNRLVLEVPQKIVKSRFQPNDRFSVVVKTYPNNGSKLEIEKNPAGKYQVDGKGRMRIFGASLRKIGKKQVGFCNVAANNDKVSVW